MKPSNEFCIAFLKASGWLDNHDAEVKAETINNPHRIKEFDCPYAVTKCVNCDWNYSNTCNFDFNSYQQGVSDTIIKLKHILISYVKGLPKTPNGYSKTYDESIIISIMEEAIKKLKEDSNE